MSIKSVMLFNHLILCRSLLLPSVFPSIRVFFSSESVRIRWPKDWSFSFSISPSNEHSGLISLRIVWLDLLAIQGTVPKTLSPVLPNVTASGDRALEEGIVKLKWGCAMGLMQPDGCPPRKRRSGRTEMPQWRRRAQRKDHQEPVRRRPLQARREASPGPWPWTPSLQNGEISSVCKPPTLWAVVTAALVN